jgi:hypothetical protein
VPAESIEDELDAELRARKLNLSRETRAVCLTIIKAVIGKHTEALTPLDGIPTLKGYTLSPEEKAKLEAALEAMKRKPHIVTILEPGEAQDDQAKLYARPEDVRDYHKPNNPHAQYSPYRDL